MMIRALAVQDIESYEKSPIHIREDRKIAESTIIINRDPVENSFHIKDVEREEFLEIMLAIHKYVKSE